MALLSKLINSFKGRAGETKVAHKLGVLDLFGYEGKCLRNLYVPRKNGGTTEIDVIYITRKGIFIIESKNYIGYIFGDDSAYNWTSTLYGGKTWYGGKKVIKNHFYNPVKQNRKHINALREYLGGITAFSIIVFGDGAELKNITLSAPDVRGCNSRKLNAHIRDIWNYDPDVYSESQVINIYNRLLPLTNADRQVKQAHVKMIENRKNNPGTGNWPWCGGNLVLRTAKTGKYAGKNFYGCSNYPRCKFIQNT